MRKLFILLLAFVSIGTFAQNASKKILSPNDFGNWKTISGAKISNNGKLATFEINPQRGDGQLIVKYLESKEEDTIPRGYSATFSPESNFIVFKLKQPFDTIRQAKIKNVDKEKMPKDSLGIFVFKARSIAKFPNLKSFSIPEENAGWIAFLSEKEKKKKEVKAEQPAKDVPEEEKKDKKEKEKKGGDNLVLYNVKTGDTLQFANVTDYHFSKKGSSIAFIQEQKDSVNSTKISIFDTHTGKSTGYFQDIGYSKQISTDDLGEQFAFLFSKDTTEQKVFDLHYGNLKDGLSNTIISGETKGMPINWSVSEHRELLFSEDGSRLYFGTSRRPVVEPKDTIPDDEKVKVDVWSWIDQELQPQQKVELDKEKKRSYLGVLHIQENKFIQLADPIIRDVRTIMKGNGQFALGKDDVKYSRESSWTGDGLADYYLVDVKSGIKRKLIEGIKSAWISPAGNFVVWYNPADSSYYSRSTNIGSQSVNTLTKNIPVTFCNELNDMPMDAPPYGIAGWGEDDRCVYIYDRYDIWKVDPTAMKVPMNVTRSFGRRNQLRLRYIKLDPKEEYISTEGNNIISSFDERSKAGGFFSVDFKNFKEPHLLVAEDKYFSTPQKAKEEDKLLFTKESYSEFPDLWVSNMKFDKPRKITDANPQQKEFNWLFANLVKWNSFTGEELEGILYMPENFNPRVKYPMIVYYYERNSDNYFRYSVPSPSRSVINRPLYASNGYLIFVPDITYRTGYPGQSAYDAIVSGVSFLTNNYSFIDKDKMGLQGQSWGGYQTAWLVTQTDMFAAAEAGAPVSNMTSAYGGIRWESGLSRMFQYEHSQSRIGGTLWDKPLQYIENSPVFYAPKVKTPLLIMHNDKDGAVPWYQGIELFVALRRLNKPVWMLSYNDEPHNLKAESWGNRMDLSIRMKGFFDHYLKEQSMPEWMQFGVPAKDKGKYLGY